MKSIDQLYALCVKGAKETPWQGDTPPWQGVLVRWLVYVCVAKVENAASAAFFVLLCFQVKHVHLHLTKYHTCRKSKPFYACTSSIT